MTTIRLVTTGDDLGLSQREDGTYQGRATLYGVPSAPSRTGRRVQLSKGCLGDLSETPPGRWKVNVDHDRSRSVGVFREVTEDDDGLDVAFSIAPTALGQDVRAAIDGGVYDGLSVELADIEGDLDDDGVLHLTSARLAGMAVCTQPAFADARIALSELDPDDPAPVSDDDLSEEPTETGDDVAEEEHDMSAQLHALRDDVQSAVTEFREALASNDATDERRTELLATAVEMTSRLADAAAEARREDTPAPVLTLAEQVVASDAGQRFMASGGSDAFRFQGEGIDLDTVITNDTVSSQTQRIAQIGEVSLPRRPRLLELLPRIPVSAASIEYVQHESERDQAAIQATQGAAKAELDAATDIVTEPIRTLALIATMSTQMAEDEATFVAYFTQWVQSEVLRHADSLLIAGPAAGTSITGLVNRTGTSTYTAPANEPRSVSLRQARGVGEAADADPRVVVLHPDDLTEFDVERATDGHFLNGPQVYNPPNSPRFGLTPVTSTAIDAGSFVVLDPSAVAILDRRAVQVATADQHADYFARNLIALRAEMRLGLAVFRPSAVVVGTFAE